MYNCRYLNTYVNPGYTWLEHLYLGHNVYQHKKESRNVCKNEVSILFATGHK